MSKTLREVTEEALNIYASHAEASSYDAMFDAGEFSDPAHGRMADKEVEALAAANGFTFAQVDAAMQLICSIEEQIGNEADYQAEAEHSAWLENYAQKHGMDH